MKKKNLQKVFSIALATAAVFGVVSCSNGSQASGTGATATSSNKGHYDNEKNALVMAKTDPDRVFNPFYSSSASDSSIISMTQIGMLGNDKNGNITTAKEGDSVVVYDYEEIYDEARDETTYKFVLRNDVKFSNGSSLTIRDVLFNLYEYLDPVYSGSSTIYSTDIVGLQEYRTQQADEKEQDSYKEKFEVAASTRISTLVDSAIEIKDDHKNEVLNEESFRNYLKEIQTALGSNDAYAHLVEDYNKAIELFTEEINTDYNNSKNSYQDQTFVDKNKVEHKDLFKTDVEMFLYSEGFITWNSKDGKLEAKTVNDYTEYRTLTEAQAKDLVLSTLVPDKIDEIVQYYATANDLYDFIVNSLIEKDVAENGQKFTNISGITYANKDQSVTVNGISYNAVQYESDGYTPKSDYNQVLQIKIKKQDPKAIWNFAFTVAPMYYYSNEDEISQFDYESHFGVTYASPTFQQNVIKDSTKIGVPVGAGAYQASSNSGSTTNVTSGSFFDGTTVYFTRNEYFRDPGNNNSAATIKNVQFRVEPTTNLTNALYTSEVDYCEPNAKTETIAEIKNKKSQGIGSKEVKTSGYGYIGVNAGKVESIYVRQAIMHSIDTQEIVNYYGTSAEAIYRSMSTENWAYPKGCTAYYPYIGGAIPSDLSVVNPIYKQYVLDLGKKSGEYFTENEQVEFIDMLLSDRQYGNYTKDAYGSYTSLKYTFTIAGASEDHPAFAAMSHAAEFLNSVGMNITVSKDSNALTKLTTGSLDVWAAAWSSTIDPDMYQVYHKESKATSVKNWGYPEILRNTNKYSKENELLDTLSDLIEKGRETTVQSQRARIYSQALDVVMQLAVELPTYQRTDLFAYNENKIDSSTFYNECTSYRGLTSSLWTVSLNQ